jgi:hypothetical protein
MKTTSPPSPPPDDDDPAVTRASAAAEPVIAIQPSLFTEPDAAVARVGYAPIVRVDTPTREIELCATSEAVDSYGTVFDYGASKAAFIRWQGNVREMHSNNAVGQRMAVHCDDDARKVYVRVRISAGARDTWEKVLDGTLRGASIGASHVVWQRQIRKVAGQDRELAVATHYELVELSLVDNPSNPDALGISIVRNALPDLDLLDRLDDDPPCGGAPLPLTPAPPPSAPPVAQIADPADASVPTELRDAGVSSASPEAWTARVAHVNGRVATSSQGPHALGEAAEAAMQTSRLVSEPAAQDGRSPGKDASSAPGVAVRAEAEAIAEAERPRSHAPIPIGVGRGEAWETREAEPARGPAVQPGGDDGAMRRRFHDAALGVLRGCGCVSCESASAFLAEPSFAERDAAGAPLTHTMDAPGASVVALARAFSAGLGASVARIDRVDDSLRTLGELIASAAGQMTGMSDALADLRARVEVVEAQPLPGGPAAFASAPHSAGRAAEKSLALDPRAATATQAGTADPAHALEALGSLAGRIADPQAQIAIAAELIRLQREAS